MEKKISPHCASTIANKPLIFYIHIYVVFFSVSSIAPIVVYYPIRNVYVARELKTKYNSIVYTKKYISRVDLIRKTTTVKNILHWQIVINNNVVFPLKYFFW